MFLLVSAIKLVTEIALLALAGQWLLGLLAGQKRDKNLFYQLLDILTRPFVRGMRLISPRQVLDRHVPLAAFLLLSVIWLAVTVVKINLCVQIGVEQCR